MVGGDGTGDHEGISMMMMPAAVVVERNLAVVAVMQALSVLADDPDMVMVSMVSPHNHISLGRRGHGRQSHGKRQSAQDHCFHLQFLHYLELALRWIQLLLVALVPGPLEPEDLRLVRRPGRRSRP